MVKTKTERKICKKCGVSKIKAKHFYRNPDGKDGYRNICKACAGVKPTKRRFKDSDYPFFTPEILSYCKHHKYVAVKKFGYFYGIIVMLRQNEYLAFSVLADTKKGSKIFEKITEAKAWLYKYAIQVGQKTEAGLVKYTRY